MTASASFHRNVSLLTKFVEPSDDFKKHFREGMFDKPNTAGFVHVSHYLLTVHDSNRFKKLIQWPINCKKSEAQYRNAVKGHLIAIAAENPDINFPNILHSHLIHAGGTKFTTIMWKLSWLVIRTYLRQEANCNVIYVPQSGITDHFSKRFLENADTKLNSCIMERHRTVLEMQQFAKTVLEKESGELAKIRKDICETEQLLVQHASNALVHPDIKKCLINTNNEEVIQMWKTNINKNLNELEKKNIILKNTRNLSNRVCDVVVRNSNNSTVLDAKELRKIDSCAVANSFPPNVQDLLFDLYKSDKLILHNFIELFTSVLSLLHRKLKLDTLMDLSQCLPQTKAHCGNMKSVLQVVQSFFSDMEELSIEVQNFPCKKNIKQAYSDNILPMMNNALLMPSPVIKINTNYDTEMYDFQKRLQVTPVKAKHERFFSRYKLPNQNYPSYGTNVKQNLLIPRLNLDDSLAMSDSEKLSNTRLLKPKNHLNKQTDKYSRLFGKRIKKNNYKAKSSILSLPSSSNANSTALSNVIEQVFHISDHNLDISKSYREDFASCNDSIAQKKIIQEDASDTDAQVTVHSVEPRIPELVETAEVEIISNDDKGTFKMEQTRQRRVSIGDLVDRYKKLMNSGASPGEFNNVDEEIQ